MAYNRAVQEELKECCVASLHGKRAWCAAAILCLASSVGCGSNRCPISGEVTFDGRPVGQGSIVLEPFDGQGPTAGGKIAEGKYCLSGDAAPLPGKKKVRIIGMRKTGRKVPAGPPAPSDVMIDEIERMVPKSYSTNSPLTCEVARNGSKTIDFNLKSR